MQVQRYLSLRVLTAQLPSERWPRAVWRALFERTGVLIVFDRHFSPFGAENWLYLTEEML